MSNQNLALTGSIGEELVFKYLSESGLVDAAALSENAFDMHKDILAIKDGRRLKVECKTRTVIRKHYAMPLEKDQWYKADNADLLYFITNPTSEDEPVSIYEATPNCYSLVDDFGPRKTQVRMYDLGKMKKVKTYNDPEVISRLYNLSASRYKQ